MSLLNGTGHVNRFELSRMISSAMVNLGATVTYTQLLAALERHGLKCSEATYYSHRKKLYGKPSIDRGEVGPYVPQPHHTTPSTVLTDDVANLIRFAAVVDHIGGVAAAERYLRLLKSLASEGK